MNLYSSKIQKWALLDKTSIKNTLFFIIVKRYLVVIIYVSPHILHSLTGQLEEQLCFYGCVEIDSFQQEVQKPVDTDHCQVFNLAVRCLSRFSLFVFQLLRILEGGRDAGVTDNVRQTREHGFLIMVVFKTPLTVI